MRNVRQYQAASRYASVFKHNVDVCDPSGHALHGYLGRPGGEYRLFEVPFCEYAMRGSPRAHPTLLVCSNTKRSYAATADKSIVSISEGPGVGNAYQRSHFANAQCEATKGRIRRC